MIVKGISCDFAHLNGREYSMLGRFSAIFIINIIKTILIDVYMLDCYNAPRKARKFYRENWTKQSQKHPRNDSQYD